MPTVKHQQDASPVFSCHMNCPSPSPSPQFVEESTRLVNERLSRKQELTKQHVQELEDFRTSADPDTISLSSFSAFSDRMSMDRASTRSNRSSKSVSVGTSSV